MDIKELLPLLFFALYWLIVARARKKKNQQRGPSAKPSEAPARPKSSLQDRLEQALQEMQQRVEGDRPAVAGTNESLEKGPAASLPPKTVFEGDSFVDSEDAKQFDPTWSSAKEVDFTNRMDSVATAFREFKPEKPAVSEATEMSAFKKAHGMHYAGARKDVWSDGYRQPDFEQAHGIHYGDMTGHEHEIGGKAFQTIDHAAMFADMDTIRKGVVMAEVLGEPKAASMLRRRRR